MVKKRHLSQQHWKRELSVVGFGYCIIFMWKYNLVLHRIGGITLLVLVCVAPSSPCGRAFGLHRAGQKAHCNRGRFLPSSPPSKPTRTTGRRKNLSFCINLRFRGSFAHPRRLDTWRDAGSGKHMVKMGWTELKAGPGADAEGQLQLQKQWAKASVKF